MKKVKKIMAVIMLFAMIMTMVSGCGSKPETQGNTGTENQGGNKSNSEEETDEPIAMGRYVEQVTDLSEQIGGYKNKIYKLLDGQIMISDEYRDFIVSKDNGASWEAYQQDWFTKLLEDETYIYDIQVGVDGTVYVVVDKEDTGETGDKPEEENTDKTEDALEEESAEETEDDLKTEENYVPEINNRLLIVKPDGTQQFVETPVESKWIYGVWVSENGRVFITMFGEPIYEVKEDGSCEPFLTVDQIPALIQFQGNLMIIDGYDYDGYLIYDMEKKTYIEDEVLADFITENYKNRDTNGGSQHDLYFCTKEEGVLYLAGEKGLYRHVIGGSVMEQVIDGSLSSFSNPANRLEGVIPLDNNEFLVLFTGGKLIKYFYDPDVPTVPNEKLNIYSLNQNDTVRQAVSLYQAANPEVYVQYEVGIDENSSLTKEDALKSLNTKIMAGDGPDVLILDNMPVDAYIDKGLLMDLKPMLDSLEGDSAIFTNIENAFEKDGKVYMMPCEINLPVILGREKNVSSMNDLKSMADEVEKMRDEISGADLLGIASERGIMKMFAMACVPSWKTENGEVDIQNITEFLEETKRIYDAQMNGLDSQIKEYWDNLNDYYMEDMGILREDSKYFRTGLDEIGYVGKSRQMVSGTLYDIFAYAMTTSVSRIKNFEDSQLKLMPGQSQNVFWAQTIAGISAASDNTELGEDFLKVLLGKENQLSTFSGLPVNKAALEEKLTPSEEVGENGEYSSIASSDGEGNYVEMTIYWPDEEIISVLRGWMEGASTPYIEDVRLEDAVYKEGALYMRGEKSLEEAIAAIEKSVALYMAE